MGRNIKRSLESRLFAEPGGIREARAQEAHGQAPRRITCRNLIRMLQSAAGGPIAMKRCILFVVLFIITPLANAQNKINVFPTVADGVFDGGYYKTTFMILPEYETSGLSSSATITCALVFSGLNMNLDGKGPTSGTAFSIARGSYVTSSSAADQPLRTGWARLSCDDYVYAQALYTYYAKDGTKIAEAAVFASNGSYGGSSSYRMIADQRGGSQLGIAIVNDTDLPKTYQFTINSLGGTITVPARTSVAKFLTEIVAASANTVGILKIQLQSPDYFSPGFYAIGLRYTGAAFTTIPAN